MTHASPLDRSAIKSWPLGLPLLRAIQRDPLGAARRLQAQHGDIAALKILFTRIYYLFRPEAARQVLVDHQENFVKDERLLKTFQSVHGANAITTEGRVWERQRRILAPAFAPKRIAAYTDLMAAAADEGIRRELPAEAGDSAVIDVDRWTTRITMDVILRALFTYRGSREETDAVSRAMRALTRQIMRELFWPLRPTAWLPYPGRSDKIKNLAVVRNLVWSQVKARRSGAVTNPGASSDILDLLLAARDDQTQSPDASLTDEEIHDNCIGLFGAGHDTSATALTWWIGLMAAHPDVARQVREELRGSSADELPTASEMTGLTFLNATIKEAMRLYPPATATFSRMALRDVRVGDLIIAKGSLVVIPIWSIHHDKRWFPNPDEFRPDRFMPGAPGIPRSAFMPFGVGPHFCLGQHFAMVEMALIAAKLIRLYDLSIDGGTTLPEPVVDLVLKPKSRLQVRFTRRE